jgi:hypothetical protein
MTMIDQMLPLAKERLAILEDVATTLARSGDLKEVRLTEIESDSRWITKRKNMIIHSMKVYDDAIAESATRPYKRNAPTIGGNGKSAKRPRASALGMRGLLGT